MPLTRTCRSSAREARALRCVTAAAQVHGASYAILKARVKTAGTEDPFR